MSYTKLFLDSLDFVRLEDGVGVWLICPVCKRRKLIKRSMGATFPEVYDFNQKVSFTIPEHLGINELPCEASGKLLELWVAVHRDADGLKICIQKTSDEGFYGIPTDWWQQQ